MKRKKKVKLAKTWLCTKILLDAYKTTHKKLNYRCSANVCPADNVRKRTPQTSSNTFCSFCVKTWGIHKWDCPCFAENLTPAEVFLILEDVIDQLETKLSKEYSS